MHSVLSVLKTTYSIFQHIIQSHFRIRWYDTRAQTAKRVCDFPAITGNQWGWVHRKSYCHRSTWPGAQHDVFTNPSFLLKCYSLKNHLHFAGPPASLNISLLSECTQSKMLQFWSLISTSFGHFRYYLILALISVCAPGNLCTVLKTLFGAALKDAPSDCSTEEKLRKVLITVCDYAYCYSLSLIFHPDSGVISEISKLWRHIITHTNCIKLFSNSLWKLL